MLTAGGTITALSVTILFLFIQKRRGRAHGRSSAIMTNTLGVISMF